MQARNTELTLDINQIRKEISDVLPVRDVTLTRFDDYEAGQWSELVFQIKVSLDTEAANEA